MARVKAAKRRRNGGEPWHAPTLPYNQAVGASATRDDPATCVPMFEPTVVFRSRAHGAVGSCAHSQHTFRLASRRGSQSPSARTGTRPSRRSARCARGRDHFDSYRSPVALTSLTVAETRTGDRGGLRGKGSCQFPALKNDRSPAGCAPRSWSQCAPRRPAKVRSDHSPDAKPDHDPARRAARRLDASKSVDFHANCAAHYTRSCRRKPPAFSATYGPPGTEA